MDKMLFLLMSLFIVSIAGDGASSSCSMDLSYVETIPWNTSTCQHPIDKEPCCNTLLSTFAIGLAEHLKDTSTFTFPMKTLPPLAYMISISGSMPCIRTTHDWRQRVGMVNPVDTSCNGDLKDKTRCKICSDAAYLVTSQLTTIDPNANRIKCFNYIVLYAAAVLNQFGTTDVSTTSCILGLNQPSSGVTEASIKIASNREVLKLGFTLLGVVIGVVLALLMVVMYWKWDKRRKETVYHREIENKVRAIVLPNAGAKWFHVLELKRATKKFSRRNAVGQGGDGVVYKGTLLMGVYWEIPKSHISCLNPWSAAYIPVGKLHLMPIGFKMKSNMVSEQALTLGPRLRFRCDEHPPFVVHAPSPISVGREGGVLGNIQVPHRLPQSLECSLYTC
ncbi:putative receptor-like protein kinase [Glycine soja]|uniref:Putative receptor-like protein kinase n=1 Tax=Glycine soja TaxID=3848 RepID=A0A445H5Z4_GLYSO|nr:putative receptor-like protein kinase [Glycine soja]